MQTINTGLFPINKNKSLTFNKVNTVQQPKKFQKELTVFSQSCNVNMRGEMAS